MQSPCMHACMHTDVEIHFLLNKKHEVWHPAAASVYLWHVCVVMRSKAFSLAFHWLSSFTLRNPFSTPKLRLRTVTVFCNKTTMTGPDVSVKLVTAIAPLSPPLTPLCLASLARPCGLHTAFRAAWFARLFLISYPASNKPLCYHPKPLPHQTTPLKCIKQPDP